MGSLRDVARQVLANRSLFLIVFLFWGTSTDAAKRDDGEMKLVCYYSNWAIYRPSLAKFTPENINPFLCTHLIYAFAGMNKNYELKPFDSYNDIQLGNYKKFVNLKTYNPKLKLLIAVGGWNEGSKRFSKMVESSTSRLKFVQGAIRFLRQHSFDGLDLDWEYPGFRDGAQDNDKEGYSQLVMALREAFDSENVSKGKSKLLLTMAVPAGQQYIDKGYDVPLLSKHLDFFNLLSYDYHTAHEPLVNHHAALGTMPGLEEWDPNRNLNLEWTVNYYIKKGADKKKIIVGIPTYGRSFTLQDPDEYEIGSPADGPGEKGVATRENGYLAYYEICQKIQEDEWELEAPLPQIMGPYAFKDDQWVGFDDEDIIVEKAKFVVEKGLGGAMVWTLDNDDFRGSCYGEQSPLINTLKSALAEAASEPTTRRATTTTTTAKPARTTARASRRQQSKPKPSTSTTSTVAPSFTTPDPGPPFECEEEGFFNNPVDCKKYFWCLDSGPSNLGLVAHAFNCPSGLFFNKRRDACDYKENVVCKVKTTPATTTTRRPRRKPKPRTTTTTTTTTTEKPTTKLTPAKEISKDLSSLNVPLDSVNMNGQNLLELLNLLQTLGGINQIHDKLHGRETTVATTTLSPTLPEYVTPRRRRPATTTTTELPNEESNRDIFKQYETPNRSVRRESVSSGTSRSTVKPRGPQFEGGSPAVETIVEEHDEEDAVDESQGTTRSGQQFPFVYHTPNRRRNTKEPQMEDHVTEPSPRAVVSESPEIAIPEKKADAPPARRVVVRIRPASGERRNGERTRRVNSSDETEPDRRGNNYVSAQTVGVRRVVRPNILQKESEEKAKGSEEETTTPPRRATTRSPPRIFRPVQRPQSNDKDIKEPSRQISEVTKLVSRIRDTITTSPLPVTKRPLTTRASGRPAIPAPRPTRASGKPAIPAPPPSVRQAQTVTSPPGLTFLPDGSITCIRRGIFRHPKDCAKFVVCFYAEDEKEELDGYIYDCPSGYHYLTDGGRCTPSEMASCERER